MALSALPNAQPGRLVNPMGKRIPLTKLPGRFVLAVGRVVELADEAAFVRFMLACRHEGQLVPAMYEWAFRGPPECFPNGNAGGLT
jgi:hypothetical protein